MTPGGPASAARSASLEAPADPALEELIGISRKVGADPDLVQGGGGNTSVKSRDGKRLFVKASGTALSGMTGTAGWAELDLAAARGMLEMDDLRSLEQSERERRVLALLSAAVMRPSGARPSVESSLHAILDRVVIHTHPVGLNVFLCARRSRAQYARVVGRRFGEPLYLPYVDPGFTLACRLAGELKKYRKRHGAAPRVVLLENHGLFVSAPEVRECLAMSRAITDAGRRLAGGRINAAGKLRLRTLACETAACGKDTSPIAREFLASPQALRAARRGAFTPDQIVYCRTYPRILARGAALHPAGGPGPRVHLIPGDGVYYTAPDAALLKTVAEVYRSAMAAILKSKRFGGPRFLNRRQAAFIENWEVEAFRARLAETSAGAGF